MLGLGTKLTSSSGLGDLRRDYNFLKGFLHSDIDLSRDSNATQTGSDGYIKYAPHNLIPYSEDFSNAAWNKSSITPSSPIHSDPLGGTNAILATTSTSGNEAIFQDNITTSKEKYIVSVYLKKGTTDVVQFGVVDQGTASVRAEVNLTNKSIAASDGSPQDLTITANSDDWNRCSLSYTFPASGSDTFQVRSGAGSSSGETFYIFGYQVEKVLNSSITTPSAYLKSSGGAEHSARFDYDKDGNKKGLLIEEARTNLLVQSQDFTTSWARTSVNLLTLASNITDPSGGYGSYKLTEDTSNAFHFISLTPTIGASAHTLSCYMKKGGRTTASLMLTQSGNFGAIFNLETGQVDSVTGTGNTAQIVDVGNSWYRCSITNDGSANIEDFVRIGVQNGAMASYTGDGVSGIYIFGAQLEAGSFPTSLIPTYGATADRAADIATVSGTAFSGFFKDTEGTIVAEVQALKNYTPNFNRIYNFSDNSFSDELELWMAGSTYKVYGKIVSSNSSQGDKKASDVLITSGEIAKLGQIYKTDIHTVYQDGVKGEEDNSVNLSTTLNKLTIGARFNNSKPFTGWIRRLRYFNKKKSDSQVQKLTDTSFLLDKFKGAKAAHSLRSLRDGRDNSPVTRIRREYDSYEADYTAAQVSNGELENDFKSEAQTTLPLDVSVEADELVQTPDFSSGTGWETGTGWTISGGVATHTGSVGNLGIAATLKPNKQYVITLDVLTLADQTCNVYDTGTGGTYGNFASVGSHSLTFTKVGTAALAFRTSSSNCVIDNASLKEVNPIGTGFSTRLINADYKGKPLMRIRRQDNTEAELYADSNDQISLSSSIKGSSQNLLGFSEDFGQWTDNGGGTASKAVTITDPFGGNNAWEVKGDTTNAWGGKYAFINGMTTGTQYTVSLYLKKGTSTLSKFGIYDNNTSPNTINLDVAWSASGVPTNNTATTSALANNIKIEAVGTDGWYRCSFNAAALNVDGSQTFVVEPDRNASSDGTVYAYGAMLEETQYESTGSNILYNGDFELDTSWNDFGSPVTQTRSTEVVRSGTYSRKITSSASGKGTQSAQGGSNGLDLTAGNKYRISAWIYAVDGGGSANIQSGLGNTDQGVFTSRAVTEGQWTNITYDAIATASGQISTYLSFFTSGDTKTFYVDDVTVTELPIESPSTYSQTPVVVSTHHSTDATDLQSFAGKENLIRKSEDFSSNWINNNLTLTADTSVTDPFGGTGAFKCVKTGNGAYQRLYDAAKDASGAALTGGAGDTYTFSIYVKPTETTVGLRMTATGTSSAFQDITVTPNVWQRISFSHTTTGAYTGLTAFVYPCGTGADNDSTTGGDAHIFGAQVNTNSLKDYVATTSTVLTGDVNVVNWYCQNGNEDFTQSTADYQPRLVMGSELVTDSGGKASVYFDGSDNLIDTTLAGQNRLDSYIVIEPDLAADDSQLLLSGNSSDYIGLIFDDGNSSQEINKGSGTPSEFINGTQLAANATRNDVHDRLKRTSLFSLTDATTSSFTTFQMGWNNSSGSTLNYQGKLSEMVFFANQDSSPKRFPIEQNMLRHFRPYILNDSFDDNSNNWSITATSPSTNVLANGAITATVVGTSDNYVKTSIITGTAADKLFDYDTNITYRLTVVAQGENGKQIRFRDDTANNGGLTTTNGKITFDGTLQTFVLEWQPNDNSDELVWERHSNDQTYTVYDLKLEKIGVDGFVTKLYDQTGNNCHAVQATAANQPQIVSGGDLIKSGNHPAWEHTDQSNLELHGKIQAAHLDAWFVADTSDNQYLYPSTANDYGARFGFVAHDGSSATSNSGAYGSSSVDLYANGSLIGASGSMTRDGIHTALNGRKLVHHQDASTTGWTQLQMGLYNSYGNDFNYEGKFSEWIWYDSDQSSNRTGIESNINTHYNIY